MNPEIDREKLQKSRAQIESETAYVQSTLALQQEKVIKKLTKSVDEYLDQSEAKMDAMINGDAFQASLHPSSSYGGTIQPLFQVTSS